jgi:hypothetical protein
MTPTLDRVEILTTRFDPADVELTVTAALDGPPAGSELRGRLMGPRCLGRETVEVAYPLRPLPADGDVLRARVIIPEAGLWEPASPFLYEGPVELWQGGQLLGRRTVTHGVRQIAFHARKGLLLNGQRVRLRGLSVSATPSDADADRFRAAGLNALLSPARAETAELWDLADRYGWLLFGQLEPENDDALWRAEAHWSWHASCAGWVFPQDAVGHVQRWHHAMSLLHSQGRKLPVGVRVTELPLGVLPGHVSFLVCEERLLDELGETALPIIVAARRGADFDSQPAAEVGRLVVGSFLRSLPDGA